MKKNKFIIYILIIVLICIMVFILNNLNNQKSINKDTIYLLQTSSESLFKTSNKFKYYNKNGELIKEETFNDTGDVSYKTTINNKIYSFGPGGLYETDPNKLTTKKISKKDINIVKYYDEKLYYYVNGGYKNSSYDSQICNNENCIKNNFPITDFIINKEYTYILGLNELAIYKDKELIKFIDLTEFKPYQKFLEINNRIFIINNNEIKEIIDTTINNYSSNNYIKAINFEIYKNKLDETLIFDRTTNKLNVIELNNNSLTISNSYNTNKGYRITYSLKTEEIIQYNFDYNSKKITFKKLNKEVIDEFKIKISKNESVYMAYKIK